MTNIPGITIPNFNFPQQQRGRKHVSPFDIGVYTEKYNPLASAFEVKRSIIGGGLRIPSAGTQPKGSKGGFKMPKAGKSGGGMNMDAINRSFGRKMRI